MFVNETFAPPQAPPAVPPAYVAITIGKMNKYYNAALVVADNNVLGVAPEIFVALCILGIVTVSLGGSFCLVCNRDFLRRCLGFAPQRAAVHEPDQALAEHQAENDDDADSIVADDDAPTDKQPVVPNEDTESPSELTIGSAADDRNSQHTCKCCAHVAQALEEDENTTRRNSLTASSPKRNGKFKKVSRLDMDL